ncbi:MAG: hypothetical protein WCG97_00550 [bacterium]
MKKTQKKIEKITNTLIALSIVALITQFCIRHWGKDTLVGAWMNGYGWACSLVSISPCIVVMFLNHGYNEETKRIFTHRLTNKDPRE